MAARSLSSLPSSHQTTEIFVPSDPLVDRVLDYLAQQDSGLLCESCTAILRLRNALLASPIGGDDRG
jgi:hypothetical protein